MQGRKKFKGISLGGCSALGLQQFKVKLMIKSKAKNSTHGMSLQMGCFRCLFCMTNNIEETLIGGDLFYVSLFIIGHCFLGLSNINR